MGTLAPLVSNLIVDPTKNFFLYGVCSTLGNHLENSPNSISQNVGEALQTVSAGLFLTAPFRKQVSLPDRIVGVTALTILAQGILFIARENKYLRTDSKVLEIKNLVTKALNLVAGVFSLFGTGIIDGLASFLVAGYLFAIDYGFINQFQTEDGVYKFPEVPDYELDGDIIVTADVNTTAFISLLILKVKTIWDNGSYLYQTMKKSFVN